VAVTTFTDDEGREFFATFLRVLEFDDFGPRLLQASRKGEPTPERGHVVLAYVSNQTPVLSTSELVSAAEAAIHKLTADLSRSQRRVVFLEEMDKLATETIRSLKKEQDPERVVRLVSAQVLEKTANLQLAVDDLKTKLAEREAEIAELKVSKRRLKEANQRLKDKL